MPDYRISQAQLLRLALLASGGDSPKFDEVFGIIREAKPILDPEMVASRTSDETVKRLAEAVAGRPLTAADFGARPPLMGGLPQTRPFPSAAPLPSVTGDEPNATGTADDATPPAKPE